MIAEKAAKFPTALPIDAEAIPEDLRRLAGWITWRYEERGGGQGRAKAPLAARTGRRCDITRRMDWASFDEAAEAMREYGSDGLGFVLEAMDGLVGVDLDDCRDPESGSVAAWAGAIVRELDSYTEVSPSGTGVKIFARGVIPDGSTTRKGSIEIYCRRRYFTVTGRHLEGTPAAIEARDAALRAIHRRHIGEAPVEKVRPEFVPHDLTDDQIIERATASAVGEAVGRLMAGRLEGYHSPSEADLALCGYLAFWTGPDEDRIARLFGRSALAGRVKWSSREDYRRTTIEKAIRGARAFYRPGMQTIGTSLHHLNQSSPVSDNTGRHDGEPSALPAGSGDEAHPRPEDDPVVVLAKECANMQAWRATFRLAVLLKARAPDPPEQFMGDVQAFSVHSGHAFEEVWYEFLACWEKVDVLHSKDILTSAVEEAEARPFSPPRGNTPSYRRLASIAWHLARHNSPAPFYLPLKRLAGVLGINVSTVSRIIRQMTKDGLIVCVDAEYSFTDGKAKEYRFCDGVEGTGPD